MTYESRKETFRKYLESSGVVEALTRALVTLYEEYDHPEAALDHIRSSLGGPSEAELDRVKEQRDILQRSVQQLQTQYMDACKRIQELEQKLQAIMDEQEKPKKK